MNRFVKGNSELCIGCRTCMIACVVAHEGKQIFQIDPDGYDFHPRLNVVKTATKTMTVQCHHCENAPCVKVCPVDAMTQGANSVELNEDKCIGCRQCVMACPFGAVQMVEKKFNPRHDVSPITAHKCDLCQSTGDGPACVRVCPTEALTFYDGQKVDEVVQSKSLRTAKASAMVEGEA